MSDLKSYFNISKFHKIFPDTYVSICLEIKNPNYQRQRYKINFSLSEMTTFFFEILLNKKLATFFVAESKKNLIKLVLKYFLHNKKSAFFSNPTKNQ